MTGVTDPATGNVPDAQYSAGSRSLDVNGGDGSLSGLELSVTLPLNIISDTLDGAGILASHTTIDSDMVDINGNDYEIPGLSDSIQTFTAFYDKNGFSIRASMRKRDDFSGDVYGIGLKLTK